MRQIEQPTVITMAEHKKKLRHQRIVYILLAIATISLISFAYQFNKCYSDIYQQEVRLISRSIQIKTAHAQTLIQTPEEVSEQPSFTKVIIGNKNSLAFKNNNPGNLRYAGQKNATKGYGGFAKYETSEEGFRGLLRQINVDQSREYSLDNFIKKYAPQTDGNNTIDYIYMVSAALDVSPITNINKLNATDLAIQIIKVECGGRVEW